MGSLPTPQSNFLLYTAADGKVRVEVFIKDESVWLTQKAMAELFGVKTPAASKHLANIFETGELQKEATLSILETVQVEGKRRVSRSVEFYNLDAIIAVGYCAAKRRERAEKTRRKDRQCRFRPR